MSVAESTARLMKIPAGTPRARRMLPTGTLADGVLPRRAGAVRCSMCQSEAKETAATAAETIRASALVRPMAPSRSEIRYPAAIGPMS